MLVRRIARPLLAAPFVVLGVDALRNPAPRVAAARPVVEKVAEQADKQLPVQVSQDVEQWVKINAGVMVGAGGLLALGRFPRLSALALTGSIVPTTVAGHRFWEKQGPERQQQLIHFLKNVGLAGATLLAAVDTEGRPSVGWRARRAARRAGEATEKQLARAQKRAEKVQRKAAKQARAARKQAKKQAKKVSS
ncbi:DoxX family protein [Geodermatophilus sp. SYSU D00815]